LGIDARVFDAVENRHAEKRVGKQLAQPLAPVSDGLGVFFYEPRPPVFKQARRAVEGKTEGAELGVAGLVRQNDFVPSEILAARRETINF
jgi:hypothetical protein